MLLQTEREAIVEFGRKLITSNLTTGSGGNLSIINRSENLIAIKPSGVDYFLMKPEDVVVVNPDGKIVDGSLEPSSEIRFHLALMKHRPDINAVVHTHQVYATTIACMNWELPAVHYLVGFSGNKVPLAEYATFGTQDLSTNILKAIGNYNALVVLALVGGEAGGQAEDGQGGHAREPATGDHASGSPSPSSASPGRAERASWMARARAAESIGLTR